MLKQNFQKMAKSKQELESENILLKKTIVDIYKYATSPSTNDGGLLAKGAFIALGQIESACQFSAIACDIELPEKS